MHSAEKNKAGDQESDDEELSENEQRNLENILVLFPYRKVDDNTEIVDDNTFEKIKSALSCRICLEVYKDPVYTKDCMHRFCKQCIEKIIRSQQNKSCPFCRTPLGSKRVLRNDYITEQINLKVYLSMEEEQDKNYYSSKIRELQDNTKGSRKSKLGESSPTSTTSPGTGEKKDRRGKITKRATEVVDKSRTNKSLTGKRPANRSLSEITLVEDVTTKDEDAATTTAKLEAKLEDQKEPDDLENHAQKLMQDIDVHNDESLMALKHLMERSDLNEIIMSLDFLTPVILEPLPSEPYLRQLENPVVKTTSAIKVEQLTKYICRKLNLTELKYNERIKIWIKKDNNFELVDRQMTVKDIGNKYWSHLQRSDWEVYDLYTHVDEYLSKAPKPIQNERVLYYSVYFDDWL